MKATIEAFETWSAMVATGAEQALITSGPKKAPADETRCKSWFELQAFSST